MLSSIGRASIRRLVFTPTAIPPRRIVVSRLPPPSFRSGRDFVRSFASAEAGKTKTSTTTTRTTKPAATKGRTNTSTKTKTTKTKTVKSKATKDNPTSGTKPKTGPTLRKKPLNPEKAARLEKRDLRETALFTEPKPLPISAWSVFVNDLSQTRSGRLADRVKQLSLEYKDLPNSELVRLNESAERNRASNALSYKAWVESYTPQQMNDAHRARLLLKRKYNIPRGLPKPIRDDRIPKRAPTPFSLFTKARWASGDLAGLRLREGNTRIVQDWKELSEPERRSYADMANAALDTYKKQIESIMHRGVAPARL